jgi:membrane-bound ClpP family serine protease
METRRKRFWWIIAIETASLLVAAAWLLSRIDRLFEPAGLIVAAAIIAIGDVAMAIAMERRAPTRVLLGPGEGTAPVGRVMDDFDSQGEGSIAFRGERWRARHRDRERLRRGDSVCVVAREGLSLVVERADGVRG